MSAPETTRRAVLGAGTVVGPLIAIPASASTTSKWEMAVAAEREAKARMDATDSEDDAWDDIVRAHTRACNALIATPAPGGLELAVKLDLIETYMLHYDHNFEHEIIPALRRDALRQGGAA